MRAPNLRDSFHSVLATVALGWMTALPANSARAEYPQDERTYPARGYAWENNTLGMDALVPAPWTPLRHDGDSVECWGRRYTFTNGALPVQITTQKRDLFAAPPKIDWRVDGRDVKTDADGKVEHPLSAAHKSVRTWKSKSGAHSVSITTSLEYDGFLHVSLRLVPKGGATIERLALEFSLPREQATLLNRFEEYDFEAQHVNHDNVLGSASRLDQTVAMGFTPSVWLGNHEVGVEWSCECNAGWSPMKSANAIQIVREGERTLLKINAISQPRHVDGPFEFNFALVPTPVKPRPDDWRRLRLTTSMVETAGYAKEDRVFGFAMGLPVKFRGLPGMSPSAETSPRDIARQRTLAVKNHAGFIPYGALYGMPALLPGGEWKDYANQWRVNLKGGSVANVNWGNSLGLPKGAESLIYVCPSQRSFQDFLVWQYVQAIEKEHINGLYFDISAQNYTCASAGHEHTGPRENGWQYFPLFSQRRLMQRLYVACRARDPGFLITQHCAMQDVVSSSFTGVVIKGEALNRTFKQKNFSPALAQTDVTAYVPDYGKLPRDYFEVNFSPQQGPLLMILPQIAKWNDKLMRREPALLTRYTRILLSRAAVSDVPVLKARVDYDLCAKLERAQQRSGILGAAAFHGPWDATQFLATGGRKFSAGLYFKPTNGTLALIVANLGDATANESITLNRHALAAEGITPGASARIISVFTGEESDVAGDTPIDLQLARDDLKIVVWK